MNEPPKQRWGCLLKLVLVILSALVLHRMLDPFAGPRIQRLGKETKAINNAKQIILALKQFAKDSGGFYPDKDSGFKSANQLFRELFKQEIMTDAEERIFGCPDSVFQPDNMTGGPPAYEKTLMPGECHWMLMKSQTASAHPKTPIIIENSLNTKWPPKWDTSRPTFSWFTTVSHDKRGRSWVGREIIIGRNDGSVAVEKLRPDGTLDWHSPPNLDEHGKSWIDYLTPEQVAQLSYWDIEEK